MQVKMPKTIDFVRMSLVFTVCLSSYLSCSRWWIRSVCVVWDVMVSQLCIAEAEQDAGRRRDCSPISPT